LKKIVLILDNSYLGIPEKVQQLLELCDNLQECEKNQVITMCDNLQENPVHMNNIPQTLMIDSSYFSELIQIKRAPNRGMVSKVKATKRDKSGSKFHR